MRILRSLEVFFGVLTGVTGLIAALVPLFIPISATFSVLVNGQVITSRTTLFEQLGRPATLSLLLSVAILALVVPLAAYLHGEQRVWIELVILWLAPLAILGLTLPVFAYLGPLVLPCVALGLGCAILATARQLTMRRAGAQ